MKSKQTQKFSESILVPEKRKKWSAWNGEKLTLIMLLNADFQLVTNGVENEILAVGHVSQFLHGVTAVAHNQMTLQDQIGLLMKQVITIWHTTSIIVTHVISKVGHKQLLVYRGEFGLQVLPGPVAGHKVCVAGRCGVQLLIKSIACSEPQRITEKSERYKMSIYGRNVTLMKSVSSWTETEPPFDLLTSTSDQSLISPKQTYRECPERDQWCERIR